MLKPSTKIIKSVSEFKFICYKDNLNSVTVDFEPITKEINKIFNNGLIIHYNRLFTAWGLFDIVSKQYEVDDSFYIEPDSLHWYYSISDKSILPSNVVFYPNKSMQDVIFDKFVSRDKILKNLQE